MLVHDCLSRRCNTCVGKNHILVVYERIHTLTHILQLSGLLSYERLTHTQTDLLLLRNTKVSLHGVCVSPRNIVYFPF